MSSAWHTKTQEEIFADLRTHKNGLSENEGIKRLKEYGPNALPDTKADGVLKIFLRQFQSPLIYILLAASITVFLMGEMADAAIILFVLTFNAIIGAVQEGRAQNTLLALKKFVETTATVLRDGKELTVPDKEVVPGDVLILQEGEKIPADARVVAANNLKIDEAPLTGESVPVSKHTDKLEKVDLQASEQKNMVFKGTTIVSGAGRAVVVATGVQTFIGKIAREISAIDSEIPLKANIRYLSRAIIMVVAGISVFLFALGLFKGFPLAEIFTMVVSLVVSLVPEGLPIVITLVLATGVWRMSKQNALIKKLQAVEALGQARVIAVDKTGTITKNELVIREAWIGGKVFKVSGVGYDPNGEITLDGAKVGPTDHSELALAGKMAAYCASARVWFVEQEKRWKVSGDPTEAAIGVFGEKLGFVKEDMMAATPLVAELPFDYKLKYHATIHAEKNKNFLTVEGAPESVLDLCTMIRKGSRAVRMSATQRSELEEVLKDMSKRGLRVVAGAIKANITLPLTPESVKSLTFVGFFGMQDVLRSEVKDAMQRATAAGIKVVMITGDHALTARSIAAEAGIWREDTDILTGKEVDAMSDPELAKKLENVSVFARVTPEHKLRIVTAYKARGEVVAMTGDGVNDAPPLVAADLGVAMGKIGTEVAKEASDIVLLDDNFGSIVAAVEEGRSIYKTIKKVILYLFSTSLGEVLTITGAILLGFPLPLLATQIIWLNFVTDGFLVAALAMEPKEQNLLSGRFVRPSKSMLDALMIQRIVLMGATMMLGTLFLFQGLHAVDLTKALTISLTVLAVFQWFNAWNVRSDTKSIFQMNFFSNKYLVGATAIVIVLQLMAVYHPFLQNILHTTPLSLNEWLMLLPIAATVVVVEEIRKFFARRGAGKTQ